MTRGEEQPISQRLTEVLDLLLDDHFALWDFADSFPDFRPTSEDARTDELIDLIERGFVALRFGKWFENEVAPVDLADAGAVLRDEDVWLPTGKSPGYVIALSDAGEKYLRSAGIGLP